VYTATATISDSPLETAWKTALRSAHTVKPYDAFSTLQAENTVPDAVMTAAPTGNRLYGLYECRQAAWAASISTSNCVLFKATIDLESSLAKPPLNSYRQTSFIVTATRVLVKETRMSR
jgi:hypothetical protein